MIPSSDEEMVTDSSEMTDKRTNSMPWNKPVVVGLMATLFFAAVVLMKKSPKSLNEVTQQDVISMAGTCSAKWSEDCWDTRCCKDHGFECYTKNHYWASCKQNCDRNEIDEYDRQRGIKDGWSCIHPNQHEKVCTRDGKKCKDQPDCCSSDHICFVKHGEWETCQPTCKRGAGANAYDPSDGVGWDCAIHGLASPTENENADVMLALCKERHCKNVNNAKCESDVCSYYVYQANLPEKETTTLAPITTTAGAETTAPPGAETTAPPGAETTAPPGAETTATATIPGA